MENDKLIKELSEYGFSNELLQSIVQARYSEGYNCDIDDTNYTIDKNRAITATNFQT